MTKQELLIFNLTEIRRRSILLWEGLLPENYDWRPDPKAFKASNMIRHVLSADYGWNKIIKGEDMNSLSSTSRKRSFCRFNDRTGINPIIS